LIRYSGLVIRVCGTVLHRLFNLIATASLILCIATIVLWVRSYWREDFITSFNGSHCDILSSSLGGLSWCRIPGRVEGAGPGLEYHQTQPLPMQTRMGVPPQRWLGYQLYSVVPYMMTTPLRAHVISDWVIALLLALTPTLWLLRRRRHRAAGHCPHCGYDLRATPDRCPECGAETEKR
jgi:hypothetical protein